MVYKWQGADIIFGSTQATAHRCRAGMSTDMVDGSTARQETSMSETPIEIFSLPLPASAGMSTDMVDRSTARQETSMSEIPIEVCSLPLPAELLQVESTHVRDICSSSASFIVDITDECACFAVQPPSYVPPPVYEAVVDEDD